MIKRISIFAVLLILSGAALAQDRGGTWEASFILGYDSSVDKTFDANTSLDVDSTVNWGFTFGYNWNDHLNLSYRFMASKPDYKADFLTENGPTTIDHTLNKYSNQFNMTYNFLSGPVTPFVNAGIGWVFVDSNVGKGDPSYGCWFDPWWGYICYEDWNSYNTNKFTYDIGAGLRWDINDSMFTRASWSREFIDVKNGSMDFDTYSVEIGTTF